MVLLLTWACRHAPTAPALEVGVPTGPAVETRSPISGPALWVAEGGPPLCLTIPAGWSGTTGAAPDLLRIAREGVVVTVSIGDLPSERPGLELLFEDEASYRTVPLLTGGGTRSWRAIEPTGPVVQSWNGVVEGVRVEVSAAFPLGALVSASDEVHTILDGLCLDR